MKLAIMQPYFFPYIGYFQLMNAVDKFVIYDDVNFINRGWVNRNRILVNGKEHIFSVPLKNASQNVLIKDLELIESEKWKNKFIKTLEHAYGKAPSYEDVFPLVEKIINTNTKLMRDWHLISFKLLNKYLGIKTAIVESSSIYKNQKLKGQHRILDICLQENTSQYINAIGGEKLYDRKLFKENGINLFFIDVNKSITYNQKSNVFAPNLSIIDVLMNLKVEDKRSLLNEYKFV